MTNSVDIPLMDGPYHGQFACYNLDTKFGKIEFNGSFYTVLGYNINGKSYRIGVYDPENPSEDIALYIVQNGFEPCWDLNRRDRPPVSGGGNNQTND